MLNETKLTGFFAQRIFNNQTYEAVVAHGTNDGEHVQVDTGFIVDTLLQNIGRYCERHLSDFLITWESVQTAINDTKPGDDYIAFGIRRMGVDSNAFLYNRVKNHRNQPGWAENFYRKIFVLRINRVLESAIHGQVPDDIMVITITLKDVTDNIHVTDLTYVETNMPEHDSDVESTAATPSANNKRVSLKDRLSRLQSCTYPHTDNDTGYQQLQTAYRNYDNNTLFTPENDDANNYMRHYMNMHEITPQIHTVDSLATKMSDNRKSENLWRDADADSWYRYYNDQIGLIAAILAIRAKEK